MTLPTYFDFKKASGGDLDNAEQYILKNWYVAEEKLDGIRIIVQYDLEGSIRAYTRVAGKNTGVPGDKTGQLRHICDEIRQTCLPGTVLDGEIIVPRRLGPSLSSEVTKATSPKPDKSFEFQSNNWFVEFAVFDILAYGGVLLTDKSYYERRIILSTALPLGLKYVFPVPILRGEAMIRKGLESIWKRGGEGLILKNINSPYNPKRDNDWVKIKRQREYDVVFMGIEEAKATSKKKSGETTDTKYKGKAGGIKFGQYTQETDDRGLLVPHTESAFTYFGTASGFDDAERDDITQNWEKYVGRVFTIKAQERLKSGAFRHPRTHTKIQWRDDKTAEECTYREDEA